MSAETIEFRQATPQDVGALALLIVEPEHWGKRIASRLLAHEHLSKELIEID